MSRIDDEDAYWAVVGLDFKVFLQQAFRTVYPNKAFLPVWYLDVIAHALCQSQRGKLSRVIINLPPRYLKSFIVSVAWPAFLMGCDPTVKIVCVSHTEDLATTFARDFRRVIDAPWYRKVFPGVVVSKSTETETVTTLGGSRYAVSVGGSLTGRGADFIIVDDPIKPEDAQSDKRRTSNNEWFKSTLVSRLDDKQRGVLVIVMQRLHVNDLTGFLEGSAFHKISLSAIAARNERFLLDENEFYDRQKGEILNPEMEPVEVLERMRETIGPANFAAQYQQTPEAPEGALIKAKYLKFCDRMPAISREGVHWVSIDAAQSTSETADYTAITVGYSDRDGHFVRNVARARWDFEALLGICLKLNKKLPEAMFIVENASAGISLLSSLRKREIKVIPHNAKQDKVSRLSRFLPHIQGGRLTIINSPNKNDWVQPLVNELLSFPNGRFDDQVDSLVYGIWWAERFVGKYWTPGDDCMEADEATV